MVPLKIHHHIDLQVCFVDIHILPRVKHPHWDPLKRSQTRPLRWTAPRRCWEYWPTTCGSAAGNDGMRMDGYFCLLIMKNKDNLIWWLNHTYPTRMMLYRIMMILTMKMVTSPTVIWWKSNGVVDWRVDGDRSRKEAAAGLGMSSVWCVWNGDVWCGW